VALKRGGFEGTRLQPRRKTGNKSGALAPIDFGPKHEFPGAASAPRSFEATMSYWVQENSLGIRQAVVHLGECNLCEEGSKKSGQDRWFGPFESLDAARDISDSLEGIAMRAECKCVRKTVASDLPGIALLNEPLFRRPEPPKEKKAEKEKEEKKSAKTAAKGKGKSKPSRHKRYAIAGVAAVVAFAVSLFIFPALTVVEASSPSAGSTPFLLSNSGPLPITDVKAECTVELQPAAIKLHNSHQDLAERLGAKKNVSIPCFQASGGSTPQISGMTLRLTVNYAIFGIHHVQQTFSFVAARTTEGFCRWVQKG
jgi:hypothetical protein